MSTQETLIFLFQKYCSSSTLFIVIGAASGVLAIIWQASIPILSNVSLLLALYGLLLLTGHILQAASRFIYWTQYWVRYIWRSNNPPYLSHNFDKNSHAFLPDQKVVVSGRTTRHLKFSILTYAATLLSSIYIAESEPQWAIWISGWWVVEAIVVVASILFRIPFAIVTAYGFNLPQTPSGFDGIILGLFGLNLLFTIPLCSNATHLIELEIRSLFEKSLGDANLDGKDQVGHIIIGVSVFYTTWLLLGFLFPRLNLLPF